MKVQAQSFLEQPLEYNQEKFNKSTFIMTF